MRYLIVYILLLLSICTFSQNSLYVKEEYTVLNNWITVSYGFNANEHVHYSISLYFSHNGIDWTQCQTVRGDIGFGVCGKGVKFVSWNVLQDLESGLKGYTQFMVKAVPDDDYISLPEMVFIPGEKYHNTLGEPISGGDDVGGFYIGKYEVTICEYAEFIESTGYKGDAEKNGGSKVFSAKEGWYLKEGVTWKDDPLGIEREIIAYNQPVIHVSLNDAIAYCEWLSKKKGEQYRLPTENEWKRATNCGLYGQADVTKTRIVGNIGAVEGNTVGYNDGYIYTAPIGMYTPNCFGGYDFKGNVWEWCNSIYESDKVPNKCESGKCYVLKGGGWSSKLTKSDQRFGLLPSDSNGSVGFRLAKSD